MGFQFKREAKPVVVEEVPERLSPILVEKLEKETAPKTEEVSETLDIAPITVEIRGEMVTVQPVDIITLRTEAWKLAEPYFELISDGRIRRFAMEMWTKAPDYFFVIGASSSGKHHAKWSTDFGGLVRHVLMGVQVAYDLSHTFGLSDEETDLALTAMFGHDILKYGIEFDRRYMDMHPFMPRSYYGYYKSEGYIDYKENGFLNDEQFDIIMCAIERHMGNLKEGTWTSVGRVRPETPLEQVVHLADYMASRKKILMDDFIHLMK